MSILRPSEATEGSNAYGKTLTIVEAKVDRNETQFGTQCAVFFKYRDNEGNEYPSPDWKWDVPYFTLGVGSIDRFVPSEDKSSVVKVNPQNTLNKNSTFYKWVVEAVNVGFDESKIEDDVTIFKGFAFESVAKQMGNSEKSQQPVPGKLVRLPWDGGESTDSSSSTSTESSDAMSELAAFVAESLSGDTSEFTKQDLAAMVLTANKGHLAGAVFDPKLSEALNGVAVIEGDVIRRAA